MRILMVNSLYPPAVVGGAEKSTAALAEALARTGDDVAVVALHPETSEKSEVRNGVRVHRHPMDNIYWPFARSDRPPAAARAVWHFKELWNRAAAARFCAVLDREKPDVVHTHNLVGFSVAVWHEVRRRGIRLVHTLRDYSLICMHSGMYRNNQVCEKLCKDCRAYGLLRKPMSHKLDAVVSISAHVLAVHRDSGLFRQVPGYVIHNICAFAGIQQSSAGKGNENCLVFGFIGALEQKKGIEIVLEATKHLSNPNWRLKIAGRGLEAYVNGLKEKYADDRIEWLGFINPAQFYPSVDVVLLASVWPEPLGMTMLESFAYGRSVICTARGGFGELVQYGKVVATYRPEDPRDLASQMENAMSDPSQWLDGGFINESVRAIFSEETVCSRYRAVYSNETG